MTPALDMDQVADVLGYSWERFRKVWPTLPGFPQPFRRPHNGRGKYAWAPEPVLAWRAARARALGGADVALDPANDAPPVLRVTHKAAVARGRADLARLMGRG